MKWLLVLLSLTLSYSALAENPFRAKPARGKPAYFVFRDVNLTNQFVIKLTDRAKIRHARAILAGTQTDRLHVGGIVVKKRAPYNSRWSYHLQPDSIEFFDFSIEVCDATILYVEEHLSEVGGAFLPGNRWCPWSSELVREIRRRDIRH